MEFKSKFVDLMDLEEVIKVYPDIVQHFPDPPAGYRWKFLWHSECENTEQADDLARLLLCTSKATSMYANLKGGGYFAGDLYMNHRDPELCWFSWGIGDSGSSATSEIWVAVKLPSLILHRSNP